MVKMPTQPEKIMWIDEKEYLVSINIKLNIISVICTPATSNLFGNISNGALHCTGITVAITLQQTISTEQLYAIAECGVDGTRLTVLIYRDTGDINSDIEIEGSCSFLTVLSSGPLTATQSTHH